MLGFTYARSLILSPPPEPGRTQKWLKRARWKKKIRKFESCMKLKSMRIDEKGGGWSLLIKVPLIIAM